MLASYAPTPQVYDPPKMSKSFYKRKKTTGEVSRSGSPARSFYGDGLRPHDLPPRGASPATSFYSHSSSSSPSLDSASSSGSRTALPAASSFTGWLARSPRTLPSLDIATPSASDFASPPETPVEVPEAELRRRQLEKATRILGESVPLELVFQPPRHPLVKAFPAPPPRRSTDGPQPGQQPRPTMTRPKKLGRRASLTLSTFTAKFRTGSHSTNHSRDSSQDSHSPTSADDHQPPSTFTRILPRRRSVAHSSPIMFSFPRRSPTRAQMLPLSPPDSGLVIDICSPDPSVRGHDDEEATPIRESSTRLGRSHMYSSSEVLPRIVPMPAHAHTDSEPILPRPETPFLRPETPFLRSETPFLRPETPFSEYTRPNTPFINLDPREPEDDDEPSMTSGTTMYLAPGVTRKERGQGWSGEWNQRDMQDVIHKLRSLK